MSLRACPCHWTPQDLDLGQMHFYWCFQAPLPFALLHPMLVLAAFSRQDAKMLCPSRLINILRLGGHSVFALQGGRSCSSSRFVDVLILPKPATQFGCLWKVFSDSLNTLAAGGAREPLILSTGSRTRQQFEGIGIFDSTAQGRDSSNQHFCGKTYLRWTLLAGTAPHMPRIQCSPNWTISVCTDRPSRPLGQAWPQQCKQGNQGIQPAQS